jgi:cyclic-di-GMP phosphodiesterase TipF (flagellum assembly factor)
MRPSIALIYVAMAVIAISLTAMLYRMTALPLEFAAMFGTVLFFMLVAADQTVSRIAERKAFQRQLELSDHALQDAFNEIDMIRSRLVALETDTQQVVDAGVAPVQQDLQAVGALLAQVTEAVADTDHRLATTEEQVKLLARQLRPKAARPAVAVTKDTGHPDQTAAEPEPAPPAPQPIPASEAPPLPTEKDRAAVDEESSQALLKRVSSAVENERIEIALQSVVTLPQRRARAYAILANLKLDGAGTLEARHALPAIEAAGVSADFDKAVILRALALAHKFASRESASIVFVPVSGSALMQSRFADWLVTVLSDNKELAGRLVLEIAQKDIRAFSPIDFDLLATLTDMGFRFSAAQLADARSDVFTLSQYGFRYAKAPVALFLGKDAAAKSDIHPEDLSDLAARNGMDLIVDQVESEAQVVELLDCKLKYGQGNLFARPRVVEVEPHPLAERPSQEVTRPAEPAPAEASGLPESQAGKTAAQPPRALRSLSRTA